MGAHVLNDDSAPGLPGPAAGVQVFEPFEEGPGEFFRAPSPPLSLRPHLPTRLPSLHGPLTVLHEQHVYCVQQERLRRNLPIGR